MEYGIHRVELSTLRYPTYEKSGKRAPVDVIQEWELRSGVFATPTDNMCDMVSNMSSLSDLKNLEKATNRNIESFHMRCITLIVNSNAKECMNLFHFQVAKIRALFPSLRCSVKRRDVFEHRCIELEVKRCLLSLNCKIRWSSTFF